MKNSVSQKKPMFWYSVRSTCDKPLHDAVDKGLYLPIERALRDGADVNSCASDGNTCLHKLTSMCVSGKREEFIRRFKRSLTVLLEADFIQVDRKNKEGKTPLMLAKY